MAEPHARTEAITCNVGTRMSSSATLTSISGKKLKEMFHLAKNVKIVDNELDLEQF